MCIFMAYLSLSLYWLNTDVKFFIYIRIPDSLVYMIASDDAFQGEGIRHRIRRRHFSNAQKKPSFKKLFLIQKINIFL